MLRAVSWTLALGLLIAAAVLAFDDFHRADLSGHAVTYRSLGAAMPSAESLSKIGLPNALAETAAALGRSKAVSPAFNQPSWLVPLLAGLFLVAVAQWLTVRGRAPIKTAKAPHLKSVPTGTDREFLPAALEIVETPPSPIAIGFLWFICLAFTAGLTWAYFSKLDIHVVAQGKIQPNGRSKVVQPVEPGKVVAINVENGSHVKAGDTLVELDPTETQADNQSQTRELDAAEAEIARRRVEVELAIPGASRAPIIIFPSSTPETLRQRETSVLISDLARFDATLATLAAEIEEKRATKERLAQSLISRADLLQVLKERVDMRALLDRQKAGSRAQVIDALQEYRRELSGDTQDRGLLTETDAAIASLERRMAQTRSEFIAGNTEKIAEAERRRDVLSKDVIKSGARNARTRLTAPISGTVQQLAVTTLGQVVSSGQALMAIVPENGPIEIEAMILNQDIGFVQAGQSVIVKVEAFSFTRFGTLDGTIKKVSADAVESSEAQVGRDAIGGTMQSGASAMAATPHTQNLVFPATVTLATNAMSIEGKLIPLSPGMAVTVEIKTGERRAIDYVLSPLREIASESAHER
jgi:hemolysin D